MARFSCRRHGGTLELASGLKVVWPILPALLFGAILLGVTVTLFEGSSAFDGVYFAFVTSLTIGYGDLVPRRTGSHALAVGIGMLASCASPSSPPSPCAPWRA